MREDMVPSLQEYLGQVRLLALSANEIDRLVEAIPMAELGRDKAELASKESAASETLKSEYRKSIAEIEKQEKAYQELRDQSEVVKLRLGSSVNQLKQMRIDIARIKAAPGYGEGAGLDQLKRRTEELSHYLEDLRTSFDESRNAEGDDPFAELERLEREAGERPEPEVSRRPGERLFRLERVAEKGCGYLQYIGREVPGCREKRDSVSLCFPLAFFFRRPSGPPVPPAIFSFASWATRIRREERAQNDWPRVGSF